MRRNMKNARRGRDFLLGRAKSFSLSLQNVNTNVYHQHEQSLTGLSTFVMKYVFRPAILRASSLFSPYAGSTSNSPCRKFNVFSEMCTRLLEKFAKQKKR
jgi:hypothetical protein